MHNDNLQHHKQRVKGHPLICLKSFANLIITKPKNLEHFSGQLENGGAPTCVHAPGMPRISLESESMPVFYH